MQKKLVIFDFDGVIVNTFPVSYGFYEEYAPGELSADEYRTWYEGNIYESFLEEDKKAIAGKLPADDDYFQIYAERVAILPLAPGMKEALETLVAKYQLSIVSSSSQWAIDGYLRLQDVRQYFDEILGSDAHTSKVHKIERLLSDHAIGADQAVMITDTLGDIREAAKAGVKSIAVTWGYHVAETLERGEPLAVLDDARGLLPTIDEYFAKS